MVGDSMPIAETHMCGKAAIGALGAELGREEEGLPDGRACGVQGQGLVWCGKRVYVHTNGNKHRNTLPGREASVRDEMHLLPFLTLKAQKNERHGRKDR